MTTIPNNYIAQLAAQNYPPTEIKQPKGGMNGQNANQTVNPFSPEVQSPEVQKPASTGATGSKSTITEELNEVGNIGYAKKNSRYVGFGGTNHPVDANGRACQWWAA